MAAPKKYFLSYARANSEFALRLAADLRASGASIWVDQFDIVPGERWDRSVESALHGSDGVLVILSPKSVESDNVLDEVSWALKKRKPVVPVLVTRCEIPFRLERVQFADFTSSYEAGLKQLHRALGVPGPPSASAQTFRDELETGGEGPCMAVIPAGEFLMGSPRDEPRRSDAEDPQHEVRIAEPFAMGAYAVTFAEYDRFCDVTKRDRPGDEGWGRANRPAVNVAWDDAQAYCAWLSKQAGRRYRLPSEAEWEYACRAGTTTPFYFGSRITTEQANFDGSGTYNGSGKGQTRKQTLPVDAFPPNSFGLHHMHGNVFEWCQDAWHANYEGSPKDGSPWEGIKAAPRVLRGGSWNSHPEFLRSANRYILHGGSRSLFLVGFRVCSDAPVG